MTTFEPITREYLKTLMANVDQMKKEIRDPARLAEINSFLNSPEAASFAAELTEGENNVVEQPTVSTDAETASQAEATRLAGEKSAADAKHLEEAQRDEAYRDAGITAHYDAAGNIIKLVQEYQLTDDSKNPIGKVTHLEARSWIELVTKQREAHRQATQAFSRLKNQKTTFKQPAPPTVLPEIPLLSDEDRIQAAMDLNSQDENVVIKADRKLRADDIMRTQRNERIQKELSRQNNASSEFKKRHTDDFNPCEANAKIMTDYLTANDLEWTVDNLELAFAATEPQLARKEMPIVEEIAPQVVANPTPEVLTETQPEPPASVIQPVAVEASVTPALQAVAANPAPPVARPGVNAGLIPGQMSAVRPTTSQAIGLTRKDVIKMSREEYRKRMANPAQRAEIYKALGQKMT